MLETELAARLTYGLARLDREIQANRQQDVLSPSEMAVLDDLAEGPKTPGQLALLEHMTPASVTRHITLLERTGMIERTAAADRRKVTLAVTRKGRQALRTAYESSWLSGRIAALEPAEQEILRAAVSVLARLHTPGDVQNTQ